MDQDTNPGGPNNPERNGYPAREATPPPAYTQPMGNYPPPAGQPGNVNQAPQYGAPPQYGPPPTQYATPPSGYPQPGYPQPGNFTPPQPMPMMYAPTGQVQFGPGYSLNPLVRDPNIAAVIEILPGFIGLMGIGHLAAGRVTSGVVLLVASIAFMMAGWIFILPLVLFTCGFGLCLLPFLWLIPIASGLWLRNDLIRQYTTGYRP